MQIDNQRLKFADGAAYSALTGGMSYDQAAHAYNAGRLSERDWRAFLLAWEWCCVRFSSTRQERAWHALGQAAIERRFERAKRLLDRYVRQRFAYCAAEPQS